MAPASIDDQPVAAGIRGLSCLYPNSHVTTLKSSAWRDLLQLLGRDGEKVMLDLILESGIFARVDVGKENYYQLSGTKETSPIGA
jgi:telomerase reverse transcriptase